MKLLSPQQVRDSKNQELSREILRSKETEEQIKRINQRRLEAEAEFNSTLARNRSLWAEEEESHDIRIREMEREIAFLEERKKQALIPIQMYKDQVDVYYREAHDAIERVKEREEILEHTQELLENKLDELSDREITIQNTENAVRAQFEGLRAQQQQVVEGNERLNKKIAEFVEYKKLTEQEIAEKRKHLQLLEINIEAREKKLQRTEKALANARQQLDDQRATLARAFERLNSHIPIEKKQ